MISVVSFVCSLALTPVPSTHGRDASHGSSQLLPRVSLPSAKTSSPASTMGSSLDLAAVPLVREVETEMPATRTVEPNAEQVVAVVEAAHVPAAFLSSSNSDPLASSLLSRIAEEFSAEVGSRHLMPSSPEYRTLWEESRAKADEEFRNLFGAEELEKARQSAPSP